MEAHFHRELTNICRKYYKNLGIISVLGILEIAKQETIEFEQATRKNLRSEDSSYQDDIIKNI